MLYQFQCMLKRYSNLAKCRKNQIKIFWHNKRNLFARETGITVDTNIYQKKRSEGIFSFFRISSLELSKIIVVIVPSSLNIVKVSKIKISGQITTTSSENVVKKRFLENLCERVIEKYSWENWKSAKYDPLLGLILYIFWK